MSRNGKGTTPAIPSLPSTSGTFDAFTRDLLDRVDTMVTAATPTMATVTGIQGGEIIVHIDGEKISRSIGFARKKGVRYTVGVRVAMKVTRSGEYIVDGIVGSDAGDRTVDREQIAENAVSGFELASRTVTSTHLATGLESQINSALTSIPANSVGDVQLKDSAVGSAQMKADAIGSRELKGAAVGGINIQSGAVDWQHLHHQGTGGGPLGNDVENLVNYAKGKGWIPR